MRHFLFLPSFDAPDYGPHWTIIEAWLKSHFDILNYWENAKRAGDLGMEEGQEKPPDDACHFHFRFDLDAVTDLASLVPY